MRVRSATPAAVLCVGVWAIAGCRAQIPDARFSCVTSADCPPGQTCDSGTCRAAPTDAGMLADAPTRDAPERDAPDLDAPQTDVLATDAPTTDTPTTDAPRDAGRDARFDAGPTYRVRVVNAIGEDSGVALAEIAVTLGPTMVTIPFGCDATFDTVPRGTSRLDIVAGTASAGIDALVLEDSIVIVGRTPSGALGLTVARDEVPPAGPGEVAVRYLNLLRTTATMAPQIATDIRTVAVAPINYGQWSADALLPDSAPVAVGMGYIDFLIFARILVTFTLPTPVSALVVLTGDGDRHPGSPGGPRAIVIRPAVGATCTPAVLPDPQIVAANLAVDRSGPAAASRVFFCQQGTPWGEASLDAGSVTLTAHVYAGLATFGVADATGVACTGAAGTRILNLAAFGGASVRPGYRYLATFTGDLGVPVPADWHIELLEEPIGEAPPTVGATSRAGVAYAHIAPISAPYVVDVLHDMTATLIQADVTQGMPRTGYAPTTAVGTTPYRFVRDAMPSTVAGAFAAGAAPANVGGMFVVLTDVDPAFAPPIEARLDLVLAPYGRPWELRSLARR